MTHRNPLRFALAAACCALLVGVAASLPATADETWTYLPSDDVGAGPWRTAHPAWDGRGVVIIDDDLCIQCGACADACPYGSIFYHAGEDRYLKCDLCASRREGPLCVQVCPVGALTRVESAPEERD